MWAMFYFVLITLFFSRTFHFCYHHRCRRRRRIRYSVKKKQESGRGLNNGVSSGVVYEYYVMLSPYLMT
jgi:hypothetical protein